MPRIFSDKKAIIFQICSIFYTKPFLPIGLHSLVVALTFVGGSTIVLFLTAAGRNSLQRHELYPDVLKRADIIVVDNFTQCSHVGEIRHGLDSGTITPADIQGELSSLIAGKIPGRQNSEQITLIDLTGLDWQDATIATLALEQALFLGLGQQFEPGLEQTQVGQRVENLL